MELLESLFDSVRNVCAVLPDRRRGINSRIPMADFGMAAFSVYFMQSPSFLAHQRQLLAGEGRSNCETLFGMTHIPCDNHIRAMLDPVDPALFHPVFAQAVQTLETSGALADLRCLGNHVLIALDGTEYHRSYKIRCKCCSTVTKGKTTEYFHGMVQASIVAPGHNRAVPLPPAFVTPQDGCEKQDCESRACRRWLRDHAATYAHLNPIYLGDDLYSCQPICEDVRATGGHFLFVCKPDSHPTLTEYLAGVAIEQRVVIVKRGKLRYTYTYRWMCDLPLRDGKDAMRVNWLAIEITGPDGTVTYRNSFITDLAVDRHTVVELIACGRARWKIENETFNTLKTKGYNLEHNFGHGEANLAAVLAVLNLLAFAFHTVADLAEPLWRKARAVTHTRIGFFNVMRALTVYIVFASWAQLLKIITFDTRLPRPP